MNNKKKFSRLLIVGILVIGMILSIYGCGNTESSSDNVDKGEMIEQSSDNEENNEDYQNVAKEVKVSELFFEGEKASIWYYIQTKHGLEYDSDIQCVFVINKGKATIYDFCFRGYAIWQPTLEDLDGKSDEEIIEFLDGKQEPYEETINIDYIRDSSGNGIEEEWVSIGSYTFKIGNIGCMLEPTTILSNQFFGFKRGNNPTSYLITRYDFENGTEIILNEIGDDNIEEYD